MCRCRDRALSQIACAALTAAVVTVFVTTFVLNWEHVDAAIKHRVRLATGYYADNSSLAAAAAAVAAAPMLAGGGAPATPQPPAQKDRKRRPAEPRPQLSLPQQQASLSYCELVEQSNRSHGTLSGSFRRWSVAGAGAPISGDAPLQAGSRCLPVAQGSIVAASGQATRGAAWRRQGVPQRRSGGGDQLPAKELPLWQQRSATVEWSPRRNCSRVWNGLSAARCLLSLPRRRLVLAVRPTNPNPKPTLSSCWCWCWCCWWWWWWWWRCRCCCSCPCPCLLLVPPHAPCSCPC